MKLLIKFPSRNRPGRFRETFNLYYDKLSGKHNVEFVISMDEDDSSMNCSAIHEFLDTKNNILFCYGKSKTKIEAINTNMDGHEFDVLLLASDDMIPVADHYDDIILTEMEKHYPNLDGVLHFNDARTGKALNTLSIMGKKMYDHFGYIYHPDYISLWCDNEFHDVTYGMGKATWVDQVIIKHGWHDVTGNDQLARRNDRYYERDRAVYVARRAAGFPKECLRKGDIEQERKLEKEERRKARRRRP